MRDHAVSLGVLAVSATLGLVVAQDPPVQKPAAASPGGGPAAAPPERDADVRAIADLLASFVAAYNAKDARALGDLFTPDAEIQDEDGEVTRGRDAIVGRFSGMFKEDAGDRLSVDTESLRFLGTDIAIEEGTASLTAGAGKPPQTNRYSVIYARQGGRWLHARIRDEQPDEDSPHEQRPLRHPRRRPPRRGIWPETGPLTRPAIQDRPAHRGRRDLHLEGHRQGQTQAAHREMVTHQ